jgi:hypothetical protein
VGAAVALLGAAGAVWITGGIARFSPGQTQKSLPVFGRLFLFTLYVQYIKWGYKTCQISSGFLVCKSRGMWGHYFGEVARGLTASPRIY